MPHRIVSLFRSKSFKIALAIILFIAAVLIILAMNLGNQAGQFVIRVQSGAADKSIMISESEDFENPDNQMSSKTVSGIDGMLDYSPSYFLQEGYTKLNEYTNKLGVQQIDNSLYVYTFYIVNTSGAGNSVGVNISLSYSNVTNHTDEIVRVLTYYQSYNVSDPRVYQKADDLTKLGLSEPYLYTKYILPPYTFADSSNPSQGVVFNDQSVHIGANSGENFVKYSIFFWVEGDDPDSNYYETPDGGNQLYGGTIKFRLDITVDMTV
ncbi:MAG: hypothetical protein K6B64_05440 [Acholeplasmatales bacterium]|nr:hypothetical protein [Acholeplasmatales bacterium]